jgi:protein-S-isoprenylcysteine O-methyltransferase Ste14
LTAFLRTGVGSSLQAAAGLLLMFAGWDFRDLPGFFGSPARAGLVALVVLGAALAVALRVETQPIRKGLLPTRSQSLQLSILLALSLFLLGFLPFADRHNLLTFRSSLVRYSGLALCGIGGLVRLFAMRRLGRHFSAYVTLQSEHRLVQGGIYRSIRHPLYLSLLLAPAGIAMVFASWLAVPIFLLSAIFVADRIRKEERLLAKGFGAEFLAYRRRSRMLVPYIL